MTRTATAVEDVRACDRYPCDHAYRQLPHERSEDGVAVHKVDVGGSVDSDWKVALLAEEFGRWMVGVSLAGEPYVRLEGDGTSPWPKSELEAAAAFSGALATAVAWLAGAILDDERSVRAHVS